MKNGACYIRVSTDKQEELSPDAQKRLLFDYAKENQILVSPEHFFLDIGISGRKAEKRPAFRDMIATAKSKEHPFDVILVWKFSRFARNQEESIVYKSLLRKAGVEVVSVSEPLPDGIMGGLIERILEWMDEYFSIRLSGEVMRGMTEKAMRGGYMTCAPLGYNHVSDGPPTVNPENAALVQLIFEKYVYENASKAAIAKYLNLNGFTTRKGRKWEGKSVEYVLENPFYIGKVRWNYTTHAPGKLLNDKEEWIIADGQHEPIISQELFDAAIAKSTAAKGRGTIHGRLPAKHWLSGFVRCARCGGRMNYRSGRSNQNSCFYCKNQTIGKCNYTQRCTVPIMEKAVITGLQQILENGNFEYVKTTKARPLVIDPIAHLEERLKDLELKEKRIRAAYLDGVESLDDYKAYKNMLDAEKADIIKKLSQVQSLETSENFDKNQLITNTYHALELLTSESASLEAKCDAIRSICEKITYDKETARIEYFFIL